MRTRALISLLVALPALGASPALADAATPKGQAKVRAKARLSTFTSCRSLVRYARVNSTRTGGRPGRGIIAMPFPGGNVQEDSAGAPQPAAAPTQGKAGGGDFSTTNVQEAGVDEPDVVKTDGDRIFALANGRLHAVEAREGSPRMVGSLRFDTQSDGFPSEMLLHEGRILVFSTVYLAGDQGVPEAGPAKPAGAASSVPVGPGGRSVTVISEVDARDPAAMKIVKQLRVDGDYVSARLNGASARVVISSQPAALTDTAIRPRTAGWVPQATLEVGGKPRKAKAAVTCRSVRRPPTFSGLGTLAIHTIDMDKGLPAVDSDALMTDAQTVYGSPKSLYVATQRWIDPSLPAEKLPDGVTTLIHKFDASTKETTTYRGSGLVPGHLLNQFSLSEHEGVLRVASTLAPLWWGDAPRTESESFVTTLGERDGALVRLGQVGGLGRGERIYSVRFIEEAGFVVTFRQVDPLYTIDLATPTAPKVRGELKILGFSAYLHPLAGDMLLGVGQDATEEGRTKGTQLSLFDVSDLDNPVRLHQRTVADGSSSDVEYDHKAFLHWAPSKLAVMPVQIYPRCCSDGPQGSQGSSQQPPPFLGAIGFRVDRTDGITEVGRITHPGDRYDNNVTRSVVIGERLFTLSSKGLKASALNSLGDLAFVAFPQSG